MTEPAASQNMSSSRLPHKKGRSTSHRMIAALQFGLCFALASAFRPSIQRPCPFLSQLSSARKQSTEFQSVPPVPAVDPTWPAASINKTNSIRDVRFISPLLDYGYRSAVEEYDNGTLATKPLLLYLPGFDGTFLSPFLQFPELHTIFDVRCMTIGVDDRSTFTELSDGVIRYLQAELNSTLFVSANATDDNNQTASTTNVFFNLFGVGRKEERPIPKRPVYLAGESFGGILALDVANRLLVDNNYSRSIRLQGLTLINPATCFDRSRLAAQGPAVAELPPWLYVFGLLRLLPLFADDHSLSQLGLILSAKALPSVIDTAEREAYMGRVALSLPFVIPFMKQETLQWRLTQWLATGCDVVANQLTASAAKLSVPVLVVAGERDGTLPSISEAERLAGILPDVSVHVVEGAGHASTCGSRVDLAALFRSRFKELNARGSVRNRASGAGRTAMKKVASNGTRAYFGMEPRYDNASVGLSPLLYWSQLYWKESNQTINII